MTEKKKEHPQAKWLRAIADGETLQWCNEDDEWVVLKSEYVLTLLTSKPADADLRIKPRTITIGEYEVVEPLREAPECHTQYFYLSAIGDNGVEKTHWIDDGYDTVALVAGMVWLRREDAELAAKAITELLTGK